MRLHDLLFAALLFTIAGLIGWLSTQYVLEGDWSAAGRNTLAPASRALVREMPEPVQVTAFVSESIPLLRKRITYLVDRYRRHKPDIVLEFIDPDRAPQLTREKDITMDGELLVTYRGRTEHVRESAPTEATLTTVLQRLAREDDRQLRFVTGHGERDPATEAGHGLSGWVRQLESRGFRSDRINLLADALEAGAAEILVIASPQASLTPIEEQAIIDFVDAGGSLLWLWDPGATGGLDRLAADLGLILEEGVVVDPTVAEVGMMLFGVDDPRVALVAGYPPHPITRRFELNTLFPVAGALSFREDDAGWDRTALLTTLSNTWLERGEVSGTVSFDEEDDLPGPLTLGVALSRTVEGLSGGAGREQRVLVVADGDFMTNAFLGRGGNLQLAISMMEWLGGDDILIDIPTRTAPDAMLVLSPVATAVIGFSFVLGVPLLLGGLGGAVWLRRRRL